MDTKSFALGAVGALMFAGAAVADAEPLEYGIMASDQDMGSGTVTATKVHTKVDGWLVVHRTGMDHKPGPVIGHAPLKAGENDNVAASLTETVKTGDMVMLMVHSEEGGMEAGKFEYTLGAKEDGPVKPDGKLVMKVVTAE